jgi:adenylosuccinate lyase
MAKMDAETYQSPFSFRYGSEEMRWVWSEAHKRRLWRSLWVALAETQVDFGLIPEEQAEDLRAHAEEIDIQRSLEIEAEIQHDLMAEIKAYADQCPIGGKIIHLGATSMDIKDNADILRVHQSLELLVPKVKGLLLALCSKIDRYADLVTLAFTHLQPAEPTTVGYRISQYAQDLWLDWLTLVGVKANLKLKGFRGAVGTSATFMDLVGNANLKSFMEKLEEKIGLPFFEVVTQVTPRHQEYFVACALAGIGASLHRMAFDWRFLQSSVVGEWSEPFGKKQVGSSAMPFKRNPINMEKIDSLARMLANYPRLAWDNAANSLLENTLDDSANRRTMLPELFLITDELLIVARRMVDGMVVHEGLVRKNLETFAPFAATERILIAATKAGADRQEAHEVLRQASLNAWEALQQGQSNPLIEIILSHPYFSEVLSQEELKGLANITDYVGDAPARARQLAKTIRESLEDGNGR